MRKLISSLAVALMLACGMSGEASAAVIRSTTRVHAGVRVVPPAAPGPVVRGGVYVAHGSTVVATPRAAHPVAAHRARCW